MPSSLWPLQHSRWEGKRRKLSYEHDSCTQLCVSVRRALFSSVVRFCGKMLHFARKVELYFRNSGMNRTLNCCFGTLTFLRQCSPRDVVLRSSDYRQRNVERVPFLLRFLRECAMVMSSRRLMT